ncbi:MAG: acyl CoA:acetate/3-ketoacid CoA transferase [Actinobacteria bacterium]|nr:acyl CoA:acetate/3-ketoacid CoA transferase [Actinomycetota bacterium]
MGYPARPERNTRSGAAAGVPAPGTGEVRERGPGKVMSAWEAVRLIGDGVTVTTSGFFGSVFAEEVAIALEERFLSEGHPRDLTLFYPAGQGDFGTRGLNRFGHEGLLKKVIAGHFGTAPTICSLVADDKVQAYNLPQGVICDMFRDIASHRPRTISFVGLGTFADPRNGGGKLNEVTTEDLVEVIEFDGEEFLAYKTFPIHVAIVRGTTADVDGNLTMEREALFLEVRAQAMAAKNSGGIVIVQVERVAERGTLNPKHIVVPGILVDAIVVAAPENHVQTFGHDYDPSLSAEIRIPVSVGPTAQLDERLVMARRAALELRRGNVVNLGMGVPESIALVAAEEGIFDLVTLTTESGIVGGLPAGAWDFGTGRNPAAIIDQPSQFDFYHGGGLDIGFMGLAETDRDGNVNVSRYGPKITGSGGFVDITQCAKSVVFLGTFTTGGLELSFEDGAVHIVREGRVRKFVEEVEQITFSGRYAARKGQRVLYVTERCVFELTEVGLVLLEVAPGVEIERDILPHMAFPPIMEAVPALMDPRVFRKGPMGLREGFE